MMPSDLFHHLTDTAGVGGPYPVRLRFGPHGPGRPGRLRAGVGARYGRTAPPTRPCREGWLVVGRRGGKSRAAATTAVYLAAVPDYRHIHAPVERCPTPLLPRARTL